MIFQTVVLLSLSFMKDEFLDLMLVSGAAILWFCLGYELFQENASAAFLSKSDLIIAGGLSHLGLSNGSISFVGKEGRKLLLKRQVPLPFDPTEFFIAPLDVIVFQGYGGAVAIPKEIYLIHKNLMNAGILPRGNGRISISSVN